MIKKILISPLFYPILLSLIWLFVSFQNYTPGTFLSGWDTLHPEFDFPLNFQRLLFGVWRPEQGLGAVSGHSAMADLPRVFILWIFHFVFPLSFLRYSYVFLCLLIGILGIYYLVLHLYKNSPVAFICSLFYLLNLGSIQQFYVPFEMFPTAWAFLPWIILFSTRYLQHHRQTDLLLFAIFSLFSTPQAYAAHLWYPFFGAYLLFLVIFALVNKTKYSLPLTLILSTLLINSFWLLPNLYYLKTSSWIPQQNQQNRLHSQEFLLKNRETGTIGDSALARGFYLNWDIYNFKNQSFQKLMPQWLNHFQNFDVQVIGYLFFGLSFLGLVLSIYQKDVSLAFAPFFVIPFILLCNKTVPFSYLFDILLRFPLLGEILRFVFTKVSTLFIFGQTIFLAFFLINISKHIKTSKLVLIFSIPILIYGLPALNGFLISPEVRTKIPNAYFNLSNYLKDKPNSLILTLPLHNPSGWTYHNWGYQGSGFIWFGIPQGILDRDSDRWEVANEESYREFSTALYSADPNQLAKYLSKYKISYLLWDQSTTTTYPKNRDQITFKYETQKILDSLVSSGLIEDPQIFDHLKLYPLKQKSLVQLNTNLPNITPAYHWGFFDNGYNNQDYQTDLSTSSTRLSNRNIISPTNKFVGEMISESDPEQVSFNYSSAEIYEMHRKSPNITFDSQTSSLNIYTKDETHGINLSFDNLPHNRSYIVGIKSNYLSGIPLRFCFKNTTTSLCSFEDELSKHSNSNWDYFLIPPGDQNSGYSLDLNAISYAQTLSLTQVQEIKVIALPDDFFEKYIPPVITPSQNLNYKAYLNQSLIKLPTITNKSGTIILSQSFNPDWVAFYFQNNKITFLKKHVLINNWANGWEIPSRLLDNKTFAPSIYIFFWPQLLELSGFTLLLGVFLWIFRHKK